MKFKNSCFVRVEDAEKRKELFAWLAGMGYGVRNGYWESTTRFIRCWTTPQGKAVCQGYPMKHVRKRDVDCGTDIERFKVVAAMKEEGA